MVQGVMAGMGIGFGNPWLQVQDDFRPGACGYDMDEEAGRFGIMIAGEHSTPHRLRFTCICSEQQNICSG